jgi:hypothetical protein
MRNNNEFKWLFELKDKINVATNNLPFNVAMYQFPLTLLPVGLFLEEKGFNTGTKKNQASLLPLPLNNIVGSFKFDTSCMFKFVLKQESLDYAKNNVTNIQKHVWSKVFDKLKNPSLGKVYYPSKKLHFHNEIVTDGCTINFTYRKIKTSIDPTSTGKKT